MNKINILQNKVYMIK